MPESVNTSIRLPAELHGQLQREAERQDRSVNYLIVQYVRRGLSQGTLGGPGFDQPRGLDFDQPYGLSIVFGELLRRIGGGRQVPGSTTLDELLRMARERTGTSAAPEPSGPTALSGRPVRDGRTPSSCRPYPGEAVRRCRRKHQGLAPTQGVETGKARRADGLA